MFGYLLLLLFFLLSCAQFKVYTYVRALHVCVCVWGGGGACLCGL